MRERERERERERKKRERRCERERGVGETERERQCNQLAHDVVLFYTNFSKQRNNRSVANLPQNLSNSLLYT